MTKMRFIVGLAVMGIAVSAQALHFTNISFLSMPNSQLRAVAFADNSIVAVGDNRTILSGRFNVGEEWLTSANWGTTSIPDPPAGVVNLYAVASSGDMFIAS